MDDATRPKIVTTRLDQYWQHYRILYMIFQCKHMLELEVKVRFENKCLIYIITYFDHLLT